MSLVRLVSWTGNGAASQVIGCEIPPAIVIDVSLTSSGAVWRSKSMDTNGEVDAVRLDTGVAAPDTILALGALTFTVGSARNSGSTSYLAMVFSSDDLSCTEGTYTGDGTGPRDIALPFPAVWAYVGKYGPGVPTDVAWVSDGEAAPTALVVNAPTAEVQSTDYATTYQQLPTSPYSAVPTFGDYRIEVPPPAATPITLRRGVLWPGGTVVQTWDTRVDLVGVYVNAPPFTVTDAAGTPLEVYGLNSSSDQASLLFTYIPFSVQAAGSTLTGTLQRFKGRTLPSIIKIIYEASSACFRSTSALIMKKAADESVDLTSSFTITANSGFDAFRNVIVATGFSRAVYNGADPQPDVIVYGGLPSTVRVLTAPTTPVYRTLSLDNPADASRYVVASGGTLGDLLRANGLGVNALTPTTLTVAPAQNHDGVNYYWFVFGVRFGFMSIVPYGGVNEQAVWNTDSTLILPESAIAVYTRTTSDNTWALLTENADYQIVHAGATMTLVNRGLWSAINGGTTATPAVMTRAAVTRVTTTDGLTVYTVGVHYSSSVVAGVTTLTNLGGLAADVRIEGVIGGGTMVEVPTTSNEELAHQVTVIPAGVGKTIITGQGLPLMAWSVNTPDTVEDAITDPILSGKTRMQIFWKSANTVDNDCRGLATNFSLSDGIIRLLWSDEGGVELGSSELVNSSQSHFDLLVFMQSTAQIACPPALGNVVIGDYTDKNIRRVFAGDPDDDGTPIAWEVLSRPAHGTSPQTNAYYRRLIIKVTDVLAGQTVSGTIWVGPVVQSPPRNVGRVATVPVAVGLGMSGYDYNSEVDLTMDIGLIGTNVRSALTGQGKIRIRGLEYHLSAKPLGRPTIFA